jgi:hypothetical protein
MLLILLAPLLFACSPEPETRLSGVYVPSAAERAAWDRLVEQGVEKIVFVKRFTYNANHYYTEYLNSRWMPGGNLCILSLRTGAVEDLVPSLDGGVFGAFDVSFDARRVVFAYKPGKELGYRLYEVGTDGRNLRQLTFSPADEDSIVTKYRIRNYPHGTEDLDPCYLPDGGIAFVSTRCRFGILCDGPDEFTTTVMYRIDGDGGNMRQLSNSSVSENTPSILPDGRILYTRWEYVDKGAVAVKCLWAMNPDGSNSTEVYGNDIQVPTTMVMGRNIPGSSSEYVFTGTPHCCPQNCVGTIVRVDVSGDIRSPSAMTYMTPDIDIRYEIGISFRDPADTARWIHDPNGNGRLFRESYPLSRSEFLVSHKPAGSRWDNAKGYGLYLLHEGGATEPVYVDTAISCFRPVPLMKRVTPPALPEKRNAKLAGEQLAECIVTDIYKGMTDVADGEVKYLRILEQVPRPWGARRFYRLDEYDQQHVTISKDTHLGLKVQYGIVTVERDGSARFLAPAGRNIFLQALDSNYMAVQTERTYVNYMPGETRSCIGCHESLSQTPQPGKRATPLAMKREAETPRAQPGEETGRRTLRYVRDVQPVWDRNCISCHSSERPAGKLSLSGKETRLFNESYENLVPERRRTGGGKAAELTNEQLALAGNDYYIDAEWNYFSVDLRRDGKYTTEGNGFYVNSDGRGYTRQFDRGLLGPVIGENHPKNGNIRYLPAKSLGSHASILAAMFSPDVRLENPEARKKAERLARIHEKVKPTREELLRITNWIDTNCQYYGTYYGRRDEKFRGHPDYRTEYGVDVALSPVPPASYE